MAVGQRVWEMAAMAKGDITPGISAQLDRILTRVRPADLNERQFCLQSKVSTSFFTDLRKGTEPGIDKVERLANRAGLRLSELVRETDAIQPGRLAIPVALPNGERLRAMISGMLRSVGLEAEADEHADALVLLLPNALEQAGAVLVSEPYVQGSKPAAPSLHRAKKGRD